MKVLVISATFPPMRSGGADYALRLCKHLDEAGLEVHVVTSLIKNVATDPRMRVYPVMRNWSWLQLPRLLRIARDCRPDVVNLHFTGLIYKEHPMVTFVPTIMKRLFPKVRFVTHIEAPGGTRRDPLFLAARVIRRALSRLVCGRGVDSMYGTILRDSDSIIVLSDVHRRTLAKHSSSAGKKCVLIPPPPLMRMPPEEGDARRRGRDLLGMSPSEFLIAYFGYIYPLKGIETLLAAFRLVAKHKANARLVIIGGDNEVALKLYNRPRYVQELEALARQLGIADRVKWTGYYPSDSDHASLYLRAADLCVLPSDTGVFLHSSSFTAAIAHGLPVIATQGEILEPPIINRENVLLCPPLDPASLASAINDLMANKELRERLGKGALDLAQEWFSWDKALKRTVEVFSGTKS